MLDITGEQAEASRRSKTRYLILGLLAEAPLSGYDIERITRLRFRFFWSESFGQIYPELKRLEEEGLIRREDTAGPRGKRLWAIEDAGRAALSAWLEGEECSDTARMETVLKTYFAVYAKEGTLERLLEAFAARLRDDLATLAAMEAELRSIPDPNRDHGYALMTIDLGRSTYRTWIDWAERWGGPEKEEAKAPEE